MSMSRPKAVEYAPDSPAIARRQVLKLLGLAAFPAPAFAAPRPSPMVGIQIFQFLELAQRDFAGTLRLISDIGYRHVELMAGLAPPTVMARALRDTGLTAPSVHASATRLFPGVPNVADDLDALISCCREVGARYLVCSTPWIRGGLAPGMPFDDAIDRFGPREWLDHAEFLNRTSEKISRAGLHLAYHNHRHDFRKVAGVTGFDVILAHTSPRHVAIELDCGWAYVAGEDPAALIRRHRGRIALLHLKDMAANGAGDAIGQVQSVPLGRGSLDIRAILKAADRSGVIAAFVEQEPPFITPSATSARESWSFLQKIGRGE